MTLDEQQRSEKLAHWTEAPAARIAQPREDHLIPLMVIAGAAGADRGTVPYNGTIVGLRISGLSVRVKERSTREHKKQQKK